MGRAGDLASRKVGVKPSPGVLDVELGHAGSLSGRIVRDRHILDLVFPAGTNVTSAVPAATPRGKGCLMRH
jgi:hypothetical protein